MNNPWNNRRPSARPPRATPLPRPEVPATGGGGGGGRGGNDELCLFGLNAVLAAFEARQPAPRKLFLLEARIPRLEPLLKG